MSFKHLSFLFLTVLLLSSCGGGSGSGGDESNRWQAGVFEPEANFVNRCVNPRLGIDPFTNQAYPDQQGTASDEKFWLRSWSNDKYLWYNEIVDTNPDETSSILEYFDGLKTEALTNSGNPKDRFHFTSDTEQLRQLIDSGIEVSTGVQWLFISGSTPRDIRVAYVEPNSPAHLAAVSRGDLLIAIDGIDIINSNNPSDVDFFNEVLLPTQANQSHQYQFRRQDNTTYSVNLTANEITTQPVLEVETISTTTGNVGYILFNEHIATAEQQLVDAVNQLSTANITDLVLDLRYNGGGFVYIASQLSYMIAGFANTNNQIFDFTTFNDKHTQTNPFTGNALEPDLFLTTQINNDPLPSLNLNRVFVLTGSDTCSASELVINGLRGIDVEVIQIGNRTCGKPYGFYATDNCGTSYFSINFRSENAKAYGDYADGFIPSAIDNGQDQIRGCIVRDDLTQALGNPLEARLGAALYFRENNDCPVSLRGKSANPIEEGEIIKNQVLKNMFR
jgi:C-terminal processing protease CtpA/Prc